MDIKQYREKHALSQKAFGDLVGVSQGMVWQWESHETNLTLDKVKKVAIVTGGEVSAHDLMPTMFPEGFEFPAEPENRSEAADPPHEQSEAAA